ncbi:SIMPL domain-containing protein [Clostridia bacterium]|nr:SIMPL domain-containing protein [Clostridia bacterium]
MKKILLVAASLAAIFALNTAAFADENDERTINVQGQSSISVTPDTAIINFGVRTDDANSKTAWDTTQTKMNDIMKSLKDLGLQDKDIKTSQLQLNPRTNYKDGVSKVVGYTATNSVSVKITDLSLVGKAFDAATAAGANTSGSITFSASKSADYYSQALAAAVADAHGKASAIATEIGVSIKAPKSVTEQSVPSYSVRKLAPTNSAYESAADSIQSTSVSEGELEISANVYVVYTY